MAPYYPPPPNLPACGFLKVTQSCVTLCDPMEYTAHEILQARVLEWIALSLLQGIFPTQELNPGLPYCRQILYNAGDLDSIPGLQAICKYLLNE